MLVPRRKVQQFVRRRKVAYRFTYALAFVALILANPSLATVQLSDSPQGTGRVFDDYTYTPDGQYILYRADFNGDGFIGLYSAASLTGNSQVRLDAPGSQGQGVSSYQLLAGQSRVVFAAGTSSNTRQLFSTIWNQADSRIQLSDAGASTGGVRSWTVSPDGNRVFYTADFEAGHPSEFNVYTAATTSTGSQVALTDIPPNGTGAGGMLLSNDAMRILFIGQSDHAIYSASALAKTSPLKISSTPGIGQFIFDWRQTPTGDRIIYESDLAVDNRVELFSASIGSSYTEVALIDHSLVPTGDVHNWLLTPDGEVVVYAGNLNQPGVLEIYKSSTHMAGTQVRLNAPPVTGGDLNLYYKDLQLTPDGLHAVYRGDYVLDGTRELFSVPLDSPGAQVTLSASPGAGHEVGQDWQITPNGSRVVYTGDLDVDGQAHLYSALIGSPSSQIRIGESTNPTGDVVEPLSIKINETTAYYVGDLTTENAYDLYRASLLAVGTQEQLTNLSAGDRVTDVQLTPDGQYAVFAVDRAMHPGVLYALPTAGGPLIPLGESLVKPGSILDFQILPDSRIVVFRAHTSFDLVCAPFGQNCDPGTLVPKAARPALFATFIPELDPSGDFNGDGQVDAADYVLWRKSGAIPGYYEAWRNNFGRSTGSGTGSSIHDIVPEPGNLPMLLLFAASACAIRHRLTK